MYVPTIESTVSRHGIQIESRINTVYHKCNRCENCILAFASGPMIRPNCIAEHDNGSESGFLQTVQRQTAANNTALELLATYQTYHMLEAGCS